MIFFLGFFNENVSSILIKVLNDCLPVGGHGIKSCTESKHFSILLMITYVYDSWHYLDGN